MRKFSSSSLVLIALIFFPISSLQSSPGSWYKQTVDCNGQSVGLETSLALDSSDYPHISYYDQGNGNLKYAFWDCSHWNIQTVDSEGNVGRGSSIALDSSDYPHISYVNRIGDYLIKPGIGEYHQKIKKKSINFLKEIVKPALQEIFS